MRKEIDINTWERKEHFEFYSNIATPHYCVAFNIDVTNLLAFTRKNKITLLMILELFFSFLLLLFLLFLLHFQKFILGFR